MVGTKKTRAVVVLQNKNHETAECNAEKAVSDCALCTCERGVRLPGMASLVETSKSRHVSAALSLAQDRRTGSWNDADASPSRASRFEIRIAKLHRSISRQSIFLTYELRSADPCMYKKQKVGWPCMGDAHMS